jgi:protein-tyrosine phosphatase
MWISKLVFFILIGMRMRGIAIMGREVMQPRGLIGLGYDSIDHCGLEIAEVCCYNP